MVNQSPPGGTIPPDWWGAGLLYYSRSFYFRHGFGQGVWKVSVDAGLGCPNRDGTRATGGCIFCDPVSFSPSRRLGIASITQQIDEGVRRIQSRHRVDKFIAYFQPGSNTYGPVERLRQAYDEALAHPAVVGLAIGTRPDCVPDAALDLLAELARRTWVSVEYGLQTHQDRLLAWLGRGHDYASFVDAIQRTRGRGIEIGAHVILGLPGQSRDDAVATARELARLAIDSVKVHNLYAVRNTRLAEMVAAGEVRLPGMEEYVAALVDFLECLPARCVVDRLSGDAPAEYLVGPAWCLDKAAIRRAVEAEFRRRGSYQGHKAATGGRAAMDNPV